VRPISPHKEPARGDDHTRGEGEASEVCGGADAGRAGGKVRSEGARGEPACFWNAGGNVKL
jgi:hypothetical protein